MNFFCPITAGYRVISSTQCLCQTMLMSFSQLFLLFEKFYCILCCNFLQILTWRKEEDSKYSDVQQNIPHLEISNLQWAACKSYREIQGNSSQESIQSVIHFSVKLSLSYLCFCKWLICSCIFKKSQ